MGSSKLRDAMAARMATLDDLSGETLAERYTLQRQIGRGGMGAVYLAEHALIHKPVAVKVLDYEHSRRPRDIERFLQEARSASKIRHEHIVDITDFGYTPEGLAFLVMEYLAGEDLASTCARERRLDWRRVVAIGRQICDALAAAHAEGIIHRDMKLENCFRISRGGNDDFIKVLDFGIAKVVDDPTESDPSAPAMTSSALVGTPEYVSPELVRGHKADARADIYAVGVILYKLLTGDVPLRGDSFMATLTKHILEAPVPPRQRAPDAVIPEQLEALVMRALEKEPDRRFQKISELGAALALLQGGPPVTVLPAPAPARPRRWLPFAALTLLAALVIAGAAFIFAPQLLKRPAEAKPNAPTTAVTTATPPPAPPKEPGPAPTPVVAPEPEPPEDPTQAADPDEDDPTQPVDEPPPGELPERISHQQFMRGLAGVNSAVDRCGRSYALRGMKVRVKVKISGATGEPLSVEVQGNHAGSTLGDCIARAVRKASFPRAESDAVYTRDFKL
jgi:hypothetical protein